MNNLFLLGFNFLIRLPKHGRRVRYTEPLISFKYGETPLDPNVLTISPILLIVFILQIILGLFIYKLWCIGYTDKYSCDEEDKFVKPTWLVIFFAIMSLIPFFGLFLQIGILTWFSLNSCGGHYFFDWYSVRPKMLKKEKEKYL